MLTEKAAALVSELEQIAHAFFAVKRLDVTIEKYFHGYYPSVNVTLLQNEDRLERNMQLLVNDEGNRVVFFANAWLDDWDVLERHWVCKDLARSVGSRSERELIVVVALALENIVNTLNGIKESDLSMTGKLSRPPNK